MEIGSAEGKAEAISLIGISAPLSEQVMSEIRALTPIRQAVQIEL
jgi:hypothetical protein